MTAQNEGKLPSESTATAAVVAVVALRWLLPPLQPAQTQSLKKIPSGAARSIEQRGRKQGVFSFRSSLETRPFLHLLYVWLGESRFVQLLGLRSRFLQTLAKRSASPETSGCPTQKRVVLLCPGPTRAPVHCDRVLYVFMSDLRACFSCRRGWAALVGFARSPAQSDDAARAGTLCIPPQVVVFLSLCCSRANNAASPFL